MPITQVTPFRIILKPNKNQSWLKEVITLRRASIDMPCNECDFEIAKSIKKGYPYIRDKFFYNQYNNYLGDDTTKIKVNFICLKCWKGIMPEAVSKNWRHEKDA